jgi:ADP-ribose pyrophosphatase YjhB (NUDIX family)
MTPGARLMTLADELRAIASNGLHWSTNEHDRARYDRTLAIAAQLASLADTRTAGEIERVFRGNLGMRTPLLSVDAAVFDESGRLLLIQRADTGAWAMPGGAAEVGETPAEAVAREVREETGLEVRAVQLLGIYDSRLVGSPDATHHYQVVFRCAVTGGGLVRTSEAMTFEYVSEPEARSRRLHSGHGVRVADAFRIHRGDARHAMFQ